MAFPFLALAGAGASMLGNQAAAESAAASSIEGAKRYADTQRGQIALTNKISDDQIARQRPFYDFGRNALANIFPTQQAQAPQVTMHEQQRPTRLADVARSWKSDGTRSFSDMLQSGLAGLPGQISGVAARYATATQPGQPVPGSQQSPYLDAMSRWGNNALSKQLALRGGTAPQAITDKFNRNLRIADQDMGKQMNWDRVKIGFGEAGSAGNWLSGTGNALANLQSGIGNMLAAGQQNASMARQNANVNAVNTVGGIPGYLKTIEQRKKMDAFLSQYGG